MIGFVGQDLDWALDQLDTLGLTKGEITEEPSDTVEAGKIISVDPSDAQVPKGTAINFVVSSGPDGGSSGEMGTDMLYVPLPATSGTAQLLIIVGGQTVFDGKIDYAGLERHLCTGGGGAPVGTGEAEVYIDGQTYGIYPLEFTSNG